MPDPTFSVPMQLTAEQRAIVEHGLEHCLITAVAGSGKTTTLAWRIRHLLEQGQDPARLLILMFNRSAREDFEHKLAKVCANTGLQRPDVRTYHALGLRLYKRFVQEGYLPDWQGQPLSEAEIQLQVWHLLRQLVPDAQQDRLKREKKEAIALACQFIDRAKTTLRPADSVFEDMGLAPEMHYLIDVFHGFEHWRKRTHRISFADMLYEPVMAIHQHGALQKLVGNKMDMILVDEYQDTNEIQHLLLRYIAGERARVTVVGDPDQTIYEFRGARPEFIQHRFADEFDNPVMLNLSYSFRYGDQVALLANHLISHNSGRRDLLCRAHPSTPATQACVHHTADEPALILRLLAAWQHEGRALNEAAILFRVWSQSVAVELALLANGVPYRIDKDRGALSTPEAGNLRHLLQLAAGRLCDVSEAERTQALRQILQFPHPGLKGAELNALAAQLARYNADWGRWLTCLIEPAQFPTHATKALRRLATGLTQLEHGEGHAGQRLRIWADTTELYDGLRSLALTRDSADERLATLDGLLNYLDQQPLSAREALLHLDQLQGTARESAHNGVQLATLHRTKGLEWPMVIIPGLSDRHIPYPARTGDNLKTHLESERRLLYVGITRAREALHLITPGSHANPPTNTHSRFLSELEVPLSLRLGRALRETDDAIHLDQPLTPIAARYAQQLERVVHGAPPPTPSEQSPADATPPWHRTRVRHSIFGAGTVCGESESAFEVRFDAGNLLNFSKRSAHLYFTPA